MPMLKIAVILATISVAVLAVYSGLKPVPASKEVDAALTIWPRDLHATVDPISLPVQGYDPF
jgi:hypothetical protein